MSTEQVTVGALLFAVSCRVQGRPSVDRGGARLLQSGWREHVRGHNPRTRRPARRVPPDRRRALPRQGGIASVLTVLNMLAATCLIQTFGLNLKTTLSYFQVRL